MGVKQQLADMEANLLALQEALAEERQTHVDELLSVQIIAQDWKLKFEGSQREIATQADQIVTLRLQANNLREMYLLKDKGELADLRRRNKNQEDMIVHIQNVVDNELVPAVRGHDIPKQGECKC